MKRTWTIIGVNDVGASHKWYLSLFGQTETAPGGGTYLRRWRYLRTVYESPCSPFRS